MQLQTDDSKVEDKKSHSLTKWIIFGLILGGIIGVLFPKFAIELRPYGRMFIVMIKAIIAPLVFSTLVVGIAGAGNMKTVGRIGLKAIIYFEIITTIALIIGLCAGNLFKPGAGIHLNPTSGDLNAIPGFDLNSASNTNLSLGHTIQHLFTHSIVDSMAKGDILQIVIFTVIFAAGCVAVGEKAKPVVTLCEGVAAVMFKFTSYIMYFAPFGVGAAMAAAIGEHGLGVVISLGKLTLSLYGALFVFLFVCQVPILLALKVNVIKFWNAIKDPVILAFSTTSSEAALPKAMDAMEKFGSPKHIVSFVMPTGYSFNLDGTTLYLTLASLFIAQAAGIDMPFHTQIVMLLTLMITSKGVAGVPRASLVVLAGTLSAFNLPVEALLIILGIDEILDMGRSATNVIGNCVATVVVAKWEKVFGQETPSPELVTLPETSASEATSQEATLMEVYANEIASPEVSADEAPSP